MAVDDLELLHSELPNLFSEKDLPVAWEEDWRFVKVDDPESPLPQLQTVAPTDDIEALFESPDLRAKVHVEDEDGAWTAAVDFGKIMTPSFKSSKRFPGSPVPYDLEDQVPPPDCLGSYLPFHYFFPVWWGAYLIVEGVNGLARFIRRRAGGVLSYPESVVVARLFIYGHEAFHHITESFATRLEVSHRKPLYKVGFDKLYRKYANTSESLEEALASAHGYRKVKSLVFRKPQNEPEKRNAACGALAEYIRRCPPGYDRALEFIGESAFISERSEFAEKNHNCALADIRQRGALIWSSFPSAFSGISRVNSRVNYAIHRNSAFSSRIRASVHYLQYRDVAQRLKKLGSCKFMRHGGTHEIWQNREGRPFPVPRHPGDLKTGTLRGIIRQAGLQMSVSEFVSKRM
jgi:predicted RNA binding protein YcfA (HicA-like mRNA interferase family)